jgi:recombination protein RecT
MPDKSIVLASNLFKDQGTFSRLQTTIREVLGPFGMDARRYLLLAQRSVIHNPKLMECTALSVATSIVEAAIRGLEIGSVEGQAYLVPFKGECQLIIGYRGFSLMAWRDANITIQSECVYAKDEFKVVKGLHPSLVHVPYIDPKGDAGKRGVLIAVYAVATLPDGRQRFVVHDREEIDRRRAISQGRDGTAWTKFYTAMAAKGPIRQLGSQVIPQAIAPKMVEAAVTDERREAGIETPPPDLALQAASDITSEAIPEATPATGVAEVNPTASTPAQDDDGIQIAEGILKSLKQAGKLIFASVDTGNQNPLELSTFDVGLLDKMLPLKNKQTRVFYRDNEKNGKTYHNIVSVEAA